MSWRNSTSVLGLPALPHSLPASHRLCRNVHTVSMRYFAVLPPDYLRPASTFWNHYRFGRDGLPVIFSSWRDARTPGGDESNTQFGLKVWCALLRYGWRMFRAVRSSPGGVWTPELGYRARPFWTAPRRWPDPVCRFRTTASTWTHIDTRLTAVALSLVRALSSRVVLSGHAVEQR